ncbi:MAG: hypothetical protein ACHQ1D_11150 [Nitrososphaerales archaeon]|jgi:hypothetical protein
MSSREWKWVNAITREVMDVDLWWLIMDKIYQNYPTTWSAEEQLKPLDKRHLLRDEIKFGISDNNFDSAGSTATFNVTHNNSPQKARWIGGARRRSYQFVITEFAYKWVAKSTTDTFQAPPWRFMATKPIFEHLMSTNSRWLWDYGVNFIAAPSTIQDGKNFANFSLGNNFAAGTQFFMDNNKWKNVLLWQLEVLEDLI